MAFNVVTITVGNRRLEVRRRPFSRYRQVLNADDIVRIYSERASKEEGDEDDERRRVLLKTRQGKVVVLGDESHSANYAFFIEQELKKALPLPTSYS